MIFDDEVEEMRRLLFDGWIEICSIECLDDTLKYSCELRIFLIPEEFRGFLFFDQCSSEFLYCFFCFIVVDSIGDILITTCTECIRIKLIEEDKTFGIL